MTHENNNGERNVLIFKIVREFGALAILAGVLYYVLAIHSTDTVNLRDSIDKNTAAVSTLGRSLELWQASMNRSQVITPPVSSQLKN